MSGECFQWIWGVKVCGCVLEWILLQSRIGDNIWHQFWINIKNISITAFFSSKFETFVSQTIYISSLWTHTLAHMMCAISAQFSSNTTHWLIVPMKGWGVCFMWTVTKVMKLNSLMVLIKLLKYDPNAFQFTSSNIEKIA